MNSVSPKHCGFNNLANQLNALSWILDHILRFQPGAKVVFIPVRGDRRIRKLQAAKIHVLFFNVFCISCPFGANVGHCIDYTNHLQEILPSLALRHGFKLVYFPSRKGPNGEPPVNISAWWLPAASRPGDSSPRIVAMHGLASNNNHCGF